MRAVIDTNVLFEGLTTLGSCADVVDAWVAERFTACVSNALSLEYEEVLTNKIGDRRREAVLAALDALMDRAEFVPIQVHTRPLSPDADDDFVIECAFNAGAGIVTNNLRDLRIAEKILNVAVMTPKAFLDTLE